MSAADSNNAFADSMRSSNRSSVRTSDGDDYTGERVSKVKTSSSSRMSLFPRAFMSSTGKKGHYKIFGCIHLKLTPQEKGHLVLQLFAGVMVGLCGAIVYTIAYYYGKIQCPQNKVECPSAWGAGEGMLEYFYRQSNVVHEVYCEETEHDGAYRRLSSTRYGRPLSSHDYEDMHGKNPLKQYAHSKTTSVRDAARDSKERYLTASHDNDSEVEILFGKPIGILFGGISQAMQKAPDMI